MMQSDQIPTYLQKIWLENPLICRDQLWPHVKFHEKQVEEIYSVRDNIETYVHAGNMLGKDFVAGFIVWWYWLSCYGTNRKEQQQIRIVTTSVTANHLNVLWSEIARFGSTSTVPLLKGLGGPFLLTQYLLRHQSEMDESVSTDNYVKGIVSGVSSEEALAGHHAKNTLFIVDEASSSPDWVYDKGLGWMKKMLAFGNPLPCQNWWYRGCKAGDLVA